MRPRRVLGRSARRVAAERPRAALHGRRCGTRVSGPTPANPPSPARSRSLSATVKPRSVPRLLPAPAAHTNPFISPLSPPSLFLSPRWTARGRRAPFPGHEPLLPPPTLASPSRPAWPSALWPAVPRSASSLARVVARDADGTASSSRRLSAPTRRLWPVPPRPRVARAPIAFPFPASPLITRPCARRVALSRRGALLLVVVLPSRGLDDLFARRPRAPLRLGARSPHLALAPPPQVAGAPLLHDCRRRCRRRRCRSH